VAQERQQDGRRQRPRHARAGKYNGGQKLLFWGLVGGMLVLLSGLLMWRAWWKLPVDVVRIARCCTRPPRCG
jgi:cytochrome b subunit of formate dehydrogenase